MRVTKPVFPAGGVTKHLRQALILLHLMTAFGSLAATLAVLMLDRAVALYVDDHLLADFSFMTIYTGLVLAGTSNWGYTRFWWVTVKLTATIALALGGRALFADGMPWPAAFCWSPRWPRWHGLAAPSRGAESGKAGRSSPTAIPRSTS